MKMNPIMGTNGDIFKLDFSNNNFWENLIVRPLNKSHVITKEKKTGIQK
jgi:hypothetical protein